MGYKWILALATFIFFVLSIANLLFLPIALATGFGGAAYAHRQDNHAARNLLLTVSILVILAWAFLVLYSFPLRTA